MLLVLRLVFLPISAPGYRKHLYTYLNIMTSASDFPIESSIEKSASSRAYVLRGQCTLCHPPKTFQALFHPGFNWAWTFPKPGPAFPFSLADTCSTTLGWSRETTLPSRRTISMPTSPAVEDTILMCAMVRSVAAPPWMMGTVASKSLRPRRIK